MSETGESSQPAEDELEQDSQSGETMRQRPRLRGNSQYEDALKLVEAVSALTDLTKAPASSPDARDDLASDPPDREIVALVAIEINTGYVRVMLASQTRSAVGVRVISSRSHNLGDKVRGRVEEETADLLTSSCCGGSAMMADKLGQWDHVLLQGFLSIAGLPAPIDAAIVFVVPLPGDDLMSDLAEVIRVAGVVLAFASGNAVRAYASLKSLVHEELVKVVAGLIHKDVTSALEAADARILEVADARKMAKLRELGDVIDQDSMFSEKPYEGTTATSVSGAVGQIDGAGEIAEPLRATDGLDAV